MAQPETCTWKGRLLTLPVHWKKQDLGRAGSSLIPMEGLLGVPEGSRAKRCPGSGPLPVSRASATHPTPVWRPRLSRLWPRFLQPCTRQSREPPHSLAIVSLIRIRGTMGRLWWGYGGMRGR